MSQESTAELVQLALEVSGGFELAVGDPYTNIVGNFDKAALTCGALGWTFISGNQQMLVQLFVKTFSQDLLLHYMPQTGSQYIHCCSKADQTIMKMALSEILQWSDQHGMVKEPYLSELKQLWGSKEMKSIQVSAASNIGIQAELNLKTWNLPFNKQSFCFFFDVIVQNGTMREITRGSLAAYYLNNREDVAKGHVIAWLTAQELGTPGTSDANKNAKLWATTPLNEWQTDLLVIGWMRAKLAVPKWSLSVANRKGSIAVGKGYVNGMLHDFTSRFSTANTNIS